MFLLTLPEPSVKRWPRDGLISHHLPEHSGLPLSHRAGAPVPINLKAGRALPGLPLGFFLCSLLM